MPTAAPLRTNLQGGCHLHHIVSVKNEGGDTAENLILLCPNHHAEADTGMITIEKLKEFQRFIKLVDKKEMPKEWMNRIVSEYKKAKDQIVQKQTKKA